ncbi:uncharacterized protein LOC112089920 [Eutrema salsugineum]|uniref:uncharacterized protein LOC112089920 n=1 Tax=Eutrema salsugineum TaxID=72664 RepID=UPI000CED1144|nr:uncharacterized protein LOC112089920 [Eutrema salsugineum]
MGSPSYQSDGMPVVKAPPTVILQTSEMWKGHIFALFHGLFPPASVIFADLNPIWGKNENISRGKSQRQPVSSSFPMLQLENRFCKWAILSNVPPALYSLVGISTISGTIGEPLPTEHSRLDSVNIGVTKEKVEIILDSSPPSLVIVMDDEGNTAMIQFSYPKLAPKCLNCTKFGRLLNRCPHLLKKRSLLARSRVSKDKSSSSTFPSDSSDVLPNLGSSVSSDAIVLEVPPPGGSRNEDVPDHISRASKKTASRARSRSYQISDTPAFLSANPSDDSNAPPPSHPNENIDQTLVPASTSSPQASLLLSVESVLSDIAFPSNTARKKAKRRLLAALLSQAPPDSSLAQVPYIRCGIHIPATNISFSMAFVYVHNNEDCFHLSALFDHFSALSLSGIHDLQSCLEDNELQDLQSRGAYFTWSNLLHEDPILRKLDRVLVNDAWNSAFPESVAIFEPPGDSDHSPSLICLDSSLPVIKKCFKYFSFLASHPSFQDNNSEAWNSPISVGCDMFSLGQRQESRIRWLKDGDANTTYFHKAVIAHQAKNVTKFLRDGQDNRIDNVDQIKDILISFYRQLLGTESRNITLLSVDSMCSIHPFRCSIDLSQVLSQIPSDEEILATFYTMPKSKAPGPDGFPVGFFLEAWQVVGEGSVKADKELFITSPLLKRFNATTTALLPKIPGAGMAPQEQTQIVYS